MAFVAAFSSLLVACGGSPLAPTIAPAQLELVQPVAALVCPATRSAPDDSGLRGSGTIPFDPHDVVLSLRASERAGVSAELSLFHLVTRIGANAFGDTGAPASVIFGSATIGPGGRLEGSIRLPISVDIGPGSGYVADVTLDYRDANGLNGEAQISPLAVVSAADCPQ